ncbi:hypothetical protein ANCCEY_13883 [Ancylostoma ceylanicum]|uniref:Uncharacterized protein n=1 Tax=Ancylostoma ceylanicum TaxID=53326 RepID=A0A0D6LB48_9BILA|nr:hypothetical protein ANCCEY_13883 [Ancylostoma ceylanicum]
MDLERSLPNLSIDDMPWRSQHDQPQQKLYLARSRCCVSLCRSSDGLTLRSVEMQDNDERREPETQTPGKCMLKITVT